MPTTKNAKDQLSKFKNVLNVLFRFRYYGVEIPVLSFTKDSETVELLIDKGRERFTYESNLIKISSEFSVNSSIYEFDEKRLETILFSKELDYGTTEIRNRLIDMLSKAVEAQQFTIDVKTVVEDMYPIVPGTEIFGVTYETSGHSQYQDVNLFEDFAEARDYLVRNGFREQNRVFIKDPSQFGTGYKAYIEPRNLIKVGDL